MNWQCLSGDGRKGQAFWIWKRCTDWFGFLWLSLSLWACVRFQRLNHVRTSASSSSSILIAIKLLLLCRASANSNRSSQCIRCMLFKIAASQFICWMSKVPGWHSSCTSVIVLGLILSTIPFSMEEEFVMFLSDFFKIWIRLSFV